MRRIVLTVAVWGLALGMGGAAWAESSAAESTPWGQAVDGIACRLTVPPTLCQGQAFAIVVEFKNVSDKPRRLLHAFDPMYHEAARFDVTGPEGAVGISISAQGGFPPDQWRTVEPGQVVRWEMADLRNYFRAPPTLTRPGKYTLTYSHTGMMPATNKESAWAGTVRSNTVTVQVREPTAEDLTVHEWGVFSVFPDVRYANAEMKAEWASMPAVFYRQFPTHRLLWTPSRVRKPFVYFYSTRPNLELSVRITFADGAPVVWWPCALAPGDEERLPAAKPTRVYKSVLWSLWLGATIPTTHYGQLVTDARGSPWKDGSPWLDVKETDLEGPAWVKQARIEGPALITARGQDPEDTSGMLLRLETERFIYYDGLMPGPNGLSCANLAADAVTLKNGFAFPIEGLLLIDRRDAKGGAGARWAIVEKMAAGQEAKATFQESPAGDWPAVAEKELSKALVARGLTENETKSLLGIWRPGFFERGGLTAIYLLPQAEYDRMIPLEVTPKPGKIVRVGVVLASRLEGVEAIEKQAREWIARLDDSDYKVREQATKALGELGPPAVPLLQRALETATGAEVKIRLKTLLDAEDASEYLKVEPAAGPRKGR